MSTRVWPGSHRPLGATWDGEGVNFAIFSEHATAVELCLFEHHDDEVPSDVIDLPLATDRVWHCYLPDARPGQVYGFRVHGPWDPARGLRFNAAKLLLDPYAKAMSGSVRWSDDLYAYDRTRGDDSVPSTSDSAGSVPKSVVVDASFEWHDDRHPRTPWNHTVIYECHVRGQTITHPDVPPHLRGTYLGLAADAMVDHLRALGVTAVELMPVHQHLDDQRLVDLGLSNYWGYNTIGFFSPHTAYATDDGATAVAEFKSMVKTLHRVGIEVILDVVYNHTAEGGPDGPSLSFRGIDNSAYYRLDPDDRSRYVDYTGTGNSLNLAHQRTLALIMDSLRYWVTDMHVDGFRFDLAPVLTRGAELGSMSSFFETIEQDPVLCDVKLIAEPWDLGPDGYQLGRFPPGWAEWNGSYRDCVRRFWRGDPGQVPELASRLTGSSEIFAPSGRRTYASINFVTCHDGFTLRDLVSYATRHNEANGEGGRDGAAENYSSNSGREGPTDDRKILAERHRRAKNLLATLFLSQGVRMILGGDELGRSQAGNNNAYCQDNELSWVDWSAGASEEDDLVAFVAALSDLVATHSVLRRRHFFTGEPMVPGGPKDLTWVREDGRELDAGDWDDDGRRALGMLLHGDAADDVDVRGRRTPGQSLLVLINGDTKPVAFEVPTVPGDGTWTGILSTAGLGDLGQDSSEAIVVEATSILVLRHDTAADHVHQERDRH